MKKRVIVCGYPKSGNTWLSRLIADIIGCPVAGFWMNPWHNEIAMEGNTRDSDYQCFKSHHCYSQLMRSLDDYSFGNEKIIYIVRDPRDVIISASNYYRLQPRFKMLQMAMRRLPGGNMVYKNVFHTQRYKQDVMTEALLKGSKTQGAWLSIPWKSHVEGYLKSDVLIIKYEDLKENPLLEAKKICSVLNIERSETELLSSIENQSFENKKKLFLKSNQVGKAHFLRSGVAGSWRRELSKTNIQMILDNIGDALNSLGYPLK